MKCHQTGCHSDAAFGRKKCDACLVADRERQRQKRLARLAAGTCVQCDSPPLPGKTRCERHHAMQKRAWAESNVAKLAKRKADAARRKAKPPL